MPEQTPTVVLVHGAFAESASWNPVVERLQEHGVDTVAAANPLRSLEGDAAYVRDVVASIAGPWPPSCTVSTACCGPPAATPSPRPSSSTPGPAPVAGRRAHVPASASASALMLASVSGMPWRANTFIRSRRCSRVMPGSSSSANPVS
jgi:hypothetical protein